MPRYKIVFKETAYHYTEVEALCIDDAIEAVRSTIERLHATPSCEEDPEVHFKVYNPEELESSGWLEA